MIPQIVSVAIQGKPSVAKANLRETFPTVDTTEEREPIETVSIAVDSLPTLSTELQQPPVIVEGPEYD